MNKHVGDMNVYSIYTTARRGIFCAFTLLFLTLIGVQAQSDDDILILDPFLIESEDEAVQVTQSISATRFASDISELPFTVNVLTEQLIEDTLAVDPEEMLQFAGNVVTGEGIGNFNSQSNGQVRLRGFPTQFNLVDGFRVNTSFSIPTSAVARVEVVKGPTSLLYGAVPPGGVVNYIMKIPESEFGGRIQYTYGQYDHHRAEAQITGPINDNIRYMIVGTWEDREYELPGASRTIENFNPMLEFDFLDKRGNLLISYYNQTLEQTGMQWRPPLKRFTFEDEYGRLHHEVDEDYPTLNYNQRDSGGISARDNESLFARLRFTFNETYTLRAAFRHEVDDWNNVNQTGMPAVFINGVANATMDPSHPNYASSQGPLWDVGIQETDNQNFQLNLLADYETKWGRFQVMPGIDYNSQDFWFYRARAGRIGPNGRTGNFRSPGRRSLFDDPSTWSWEQPTAVQYVVDDPNTAELEGYGLLRNNEGTSGESTDFYIYTAGYFFDDNLVLTYGYRQSDYESESISSDRVVLARGSDRFVSDSNEDSESIQQAGIVYKLIPDKLHIYANYAESFEPQFRSIEQIDPDNNPFDTDLNGDGILEPDFSDNNIVLAAPLFGEGAELGLKTEFFDGKLTVSAALFEATNNNLIRNIIVTTDPGSYLPWFPNLDDSLAQAYAEAEGGGNVRLDEFQVQSGEEEATGYEIEVTATPLSNWNVRMTYTNLDAKLISDVTRPEVNGRVLPNSPEHNFNIYTRYAFREGILDGLSVGGTVDYLSGRTSRAPQQGNGGTWLGERTLINVFTGYRWSTDKLTYRVNLSLANITNEFTSSGPGFGRLVPRSSFRFRFGIDF